MYRLLRVPSLLFVVVIVLSLIPGATLAQPDSGSRVEALFWQITEIAETEGIDAANAFFNALSADDQAALRNAILDVSPVEETSTIAQISPESMGLGADAALAGGCWGWQTSRLYENAFGADMFRYYHRTEWCGNGSALTSLSSYAWAEVYSIWWDFSGHITNGAIVSGGVGYYHAGTFSQGRFRGAFGDVLGQTRTPWMRHDINANGGYSLTQGG